MDMLDREEEMKLSIIIPVYNAERFLKRCLDSVIIPEDHLKEVEVIIVDDGSTDKSPEILDAETDRVGFCIIHKPHGGCCSARNIGIREAKGEYITFLDSDDLYRPGSVAIMLQAIKDHPVEMIQFNDNRVHHFNLEKTYTLRELPKKWVLVWNKCYKREFLIKNKILFPKGVIFEEDRAFNLKCFHYCDSIYHTGKQTVEKCFDNKSSICHTVDKEKIISSAEAMIELAKWEDKPEVLRIIRSCLEDLWKSKKALEQFGGV